MEWHKAAHIYSLTALEVRNLKLVCWQGCIPSGSFRVASISLSFQLLEVTRIPWVMAPSLVFKGHHSNLWFCRYICFFCLFTFLPPFCDVPYNYIGPPCKSQDNLPISKSYFKCICKIPFAVLGDIFTESGD